MTLLLKMQRKLQGGDAEGSGARQGNLEAEMFLLEDEQSDGFEQQ